MEDLRSIAIFDQASLQEDINPIKALELIEKIPKTDMDLLNINTLYNHPKD